jgi:hypothetical protein
VLSPAWGLGGEGPIPRPQHSPTYLCHCTQEHRLRRQEKTILKVSHNACKWQVSPENI